MGTKQAEKLVVYRAARGLGATQLEASRKAGVSARTACRWDQVPALEAVRAALLKSGILTKPQALVALSDLAVNGPPAYRTAAIAGISRMQGWDSAYKYETRDISKEKFLDWLKKAQLEDSRIRPKIEAAAIRNPPLLTDT